MRAMAISAIVLFLVTWRLWTPQTLIPQIPFFAWWVDCPGVIDWIAFALLIPAALAVALSSSGGRFRTAGLFVWVVSYCVLLALNQHRLQPWAYHFFLLSVFALTMEPRRFLRCARVLLISIYAYSSISKFDFQFAQTVGWQINETLLSLASVDTEGWSTEAKWQAAFVVAGSEGIAAVLLAIPGQLTRRIGLVLAIGMHLCLLLALGPWGLNHHWPVLIWNVFFLVQLVILFGPEWLFPGLGNSSDATSARTESTQIQGPRQNASVMGTIVFWFAVLLPIGTFWQVTDHWPAWELYSPRASRCELVSQDLPSFLPHRGRDQLRTMNQWSLERLGVPIYPQARFQVGVALAIADAIPLEARRGLSIEVKSVSRRWEGTRETSTYSGSRAAPYRLKDARSRYLLNTKERKLFRLTNVD